ncbi:MAG: M48 family metallopeptidase [Vampirovibrionales bacterium]|nr:M48 family metallopeptidase [Vampirovibrionales bacterium]
MVCLAKRALKRVFTPFFLAKTLALAIALTPIITASHSQAGTVAPPPPGSSAGNGSGNAPNQPVLDAQGCPLTIVSGPFAGEPVWAAGTQQARALTQQLLQRNQLAPNTVSCVYAFTSDDLNASTDGRNLYVTQALWQLLDSPSERAFVVGHELSHITRHHIPQTAGRRIGIAATQSLVGWLTRGNAPATAATVKKASQVGLALLDLRYSREAEYEADHYGLMLMQQAGYSPQGAVTALQRLEDASGATTPEFLRSHPLNTARIQALANQMR